MSNAAISKRLGNPNDEFYTLPETVEAELSHYSAFLRGKRIYLPADGPESAFVAFFRERFDALGILSCTATQYAPGGIGRKTTITATGLTVEPLQGDGDFLGDECQGILAASDCVITNPPFSIFRDFLFRILDSGKDFILLGGFLALTYSAVFDAFHAGKFRLGYATGSQRFKRPSGELETAHIRFFTSFPVAPPRKALRPSATFDESRFPLYDRFPVRFVSRIRDIPKDYAGALAVPFTVFDYDLTGWEVLGRVREPMRIQGKRVFHRVIVRRLESLESEKNK